MFISWIGREETDGHNSISDIRHAPGRTAYQQYQPPDDVFHNHRHSLSNECKIQHLPGLSKIDMQQASLLPETFDRLDLC